MWITSCDITSVSCVRVCSSVMHFLVFLMLGISSSHCGILNFLPESLMSTFVWQEEYISSKISFRLVKKSWRPLGVTSDEVIDEYPGDVKSAYSSLWNSPPYEYLEQPFSRAEMLFTMTNEKGMTEYDPSLESIIIIHPLFSTADVFFVRTSIAAMAMRNLHKKYNIFAVDMPVLNLNMILTIFRETVGLPTKYEPMARALCSIIIKGMLHKHWKPEQIHLIGYSYSGNLLGYMGRYIQLISDKKLATLTCLDPYSAVYNSNLFHLSRDDARVVHIYHTCSYMTGTRERIGTADFVFNDGFLQPECTHNLLSRTIPEPFICSHLKVVPRFWYVILFPSKFKARRCDSWRRFESCFCDENPTALMTFPIGDNPAEGIYYLTTTGTKPYGKGEEGSKCARERREKYDAMKEKEIRRSMVDKNLAKILLSSD